MQNDFINTFWWQMVRAQVTNGEPMGTKDVEAQIKFLKEDIDVLLLNPESAGYPPSDPLQGYLAHDKPQLRRSLQ